MSTIPTQAELEQSLKHLQKFMSEALNYGAVNTENLVDHVDDLLGSSNWPGGSVLGSLGAQTRRLFANFVQQRTAAKFDPIATGYLNLADSEFTSVFEGWKDIWDYNTGATRRVLSRDITYDTSVSTTGTGNPTWYRLTTDADGYEIQSAYLDDIVAECISKGSSGGEEVLRITMARAIDALSLFVAGEENGNGEVGIIQLRNSDDVLQDSSMEIGTAADSDPSSLGLWVDSAGVYGSSKYAILEDGHIASVREQSLGEDHEDGKKLALEIKGNHTIFQKINSSLGTTEPYHWGFFAKKKTTATGNVTMTVGDNASATTTIAALSSSAFTAVPCTLNQNLWPQNFMDVANPKISIAVDSLATDTVIVDGVWFHKMNRYNGTFWLPRPGSTQLQVGYKGTFNDVLNTESPFQLLLLLIFGVQRVTSRGVGVYWPHTPSGTPPEIVAT